MPQNTTFGDAFIEFEDTSGNLRWIRKDSIFEITYGVPIVSPEQCQALRIDAETCYTSIKTVIGGVATAYLTATTPQDIIADFDRYAMESIPVSESTE